MTSSGMFYAIALVFFSILLILKKFVLKLFRRIPFLRNHTKRTKITFVTICSIGVVVSTFMQFYIGNKNDKIKDRSNENFQQLTVQKLDNQAEKSNSFYKETNIKLEALTVDRRELQKYIRELQKLPSEEQKQQTINKWYHDTIITLTEKDLLEMFLNELATNIINLKIASESVRNDELAKAIKNVGVALKNGNVDSLYLIYDEFQTRQTSDKVILLEQLINASMSMYNYEDAKIYYDELILLSPTFEKYYNHAMFLMNLNYYADAKISLKHALHEVEKIKANSNIIYRLKINIENTLGCLEADEGNKLTALEYFNNALSLCDNLKNSKSFEDLIIPIGITVNLAKLDHSIGESENAITQYQNAIAAYLKIKNSDTAPSKVKFEVIYNLGICLDNLSTIYAESWRLESALNCLNSALSVRRSIINDYPRVLPTIADNLLNLSTLYLQLDKRNESIFYINEALNFYKLNWDNHKIMLSPSYANTLSNAAEVYRNFGDMQKCKMFAAQSLEIYRKLAKDQPKYYNISLAKSIYINAICLKDTSGDKGEVLKRYHEALVYVDKSVDPQDIAFKATVLESVALTYLQQDELGQALKYYVESNILFKDLYEIDRKSFSVDYAHSLMIGVANFSQNKDQLDTARFILSNSYPSGRVQSILRKINDMQIN